MFCACHCFGWLSQSIQAYHMKLISKREHENLKKQLAGKPAVFSRWLWWCEWGKAGRTFQDFSVMKKQTCLQNWRIMYSLWKGAPLYAQVTLFPWLITLKNWLGNTMFINACWKTLNVKKSCKIFCRFFFMNELWKCFFFLHWFRNLSWYFSEPSNGELLSLA